MGEAVLFSIVASSALVMGGVAGSYWRPPEQVTGVLLAFASGSLIAALCFELFPEAFELGGAWHAGLGPSTYVGVDGPHGILCQGWCCRSVQQRSRPPWSLSASVARQSG